MGIVLNIEQGEIGGIDVIRNRHGNSGSIRRDVTPILKEASQVGASAAKLHAPKGATGRLEDNISADAISFRVRGDTIQTRFGVQSVPNPVRGSRLYPMYVHEGTGLFGARRRLITPRRQKYMVFPGFTGIVVTRTVRGQRPQPYMERAYDQARAYVEAHLNELAERLID